MEISRRELLIHSLQGQYLLKKGPKREVVSRLCGLQAQFAQNPRYALQIRAEDYTDKGWSDGLLKVWAHRNTLHLIRQEELGLYLSAKEGPPRPWEDTWWGIPKEVKPYWSAFICREIAAGNDQREGIKEACRRDGMEEELLEKIFHGWGGLIKEMSDRGMIAYCPGTEKRFLLPPKPDFLPMEQARLEVMARYFAVFGPATVEDCSDFTGFKLGETRRLFKKLELPLKELTCEGTTYYYLKEPEEDRLPACLLLSGFDQMIMGYHDRSRIFDPADKRKVITCSGIVFPTILLQGRIRARWKRVPGGLEVTPFCSLSLRSKNLIETAARRVFGKDTRVSFLPEI